MKIQLKIDSRGRLYLPPEIREKIGNIPRGVPEDHIPRAEKNGKTRKLATLTPDQEILALKITPSETP